jgi:hypothetical protein
MHLASTVYKDFWRIEANGKILITDRVIRVPQGASPTSNTHPQKRQDRVRFEDCRRKIGIFMLWFRFTDFALHGRPLRTFVFNS